MERHLRRVRPRRRAQIDLTFRSSTYDDFRQLLARQAGRPVTIRAHLAFPEQAKDRYPAVIVVHAISGYRDAHEGDIAAELRKAGFATLTYRQLCRAWHHRGGVCIVTRLSGGRRGGRLRRASASGAPTADRRRPRCHPRLLVTAPMWRIMRRSRLLRAALNCGTGPLCRACRFLSRRHLRRVCRAQRLYRIAGVHAARRQGRQSAGGEDRGLSGLRPGRRPSGADRARDLSGCLHAWTVSGVPSASTRLRQYEEMSGYPSRDEPGHSLVEGQPKPFDPAAFVGACRSAGYSMGFDAAVRVHRSPTRSGSFSARSSRRA